jgi:hypothetical protein
VPQHFRSVRHRPAARRDHVLISCRRQGGANWPGWLMARACRGALPRTSPECGASHLPNGLPPANRADAGSSRYQRVFEFERRVGAGTETRPDARVDHLDQKLDDASNGCQPAGTDINAEMVDPLDRPGAEHSLHNVLHVDPVDLPDAASQRGCPALEQLENDVGYYFANILRPRTVDHANAQVYDRQTVQCRKHSPVDRRGRLGCRIGRARRTWGIPDPFFHRTG